MFSWNNVKDEILSHASFDIQFPVRAETVIRQVFSSFIATQGIIMFHKQS